MALNYGNYQVQKSCNKIKQYLSNLFKIACLKGNEDVVKYLIANGAKVNENVPLCSGSY